MMVQTCAAARKVRGFTLIETALATVIIGVGVVAMVEAQQSFMRTNRWSSHASSGTLMGNEIRELSRGFPRHDVVSGLTIAGNPAALAGWGSDPGEVVVTDFDDIDDFDGIQFGNGGQLPGPIDAFGDVIPQTLADGREMGRSFWMARATRCCWRAGPSASSSTRSCRGFRRRRPRATAVDRQPDPAGGQHGSGFVMAVHNTGTSQGRSVHP